MQILTDKLEKNLKASTAVMQEELTGSLALTVGKMKQVVVRIKNEVGPMEEAKTSPKELVDLTISRDGSNDEEKKKKSDGSYGESTRKKSASDKIEDSPTKKKSDDGKENKNRESKYGKSDDGDKKNKAREKRATELGGGANRSTHGANKDDDDDIQSRGKTKRLGLVI